MHSGDNQLQDWSYPESAELFADSLPVILSAAAQPTGPNRNFAGIPPNAHCASFVKAGWLGNSESVNSHCTVSVPKFQL